MSEDKICSECKDRPEEVREFCVRCYYRLLRNNKIEKLLPEKRWKHRLTEINETKREANCSHCGIVKVFPRDKNRWRCSLASNERSKDYKKAYRQVRKNQLGGECEICLKTEKLCWDHNHVTNTFRGTLCKSCNTAIGFLLDKPELCLKAAEYLKSKSTPI